VREHDRRVRVEADGDVVADEFAHGVAQRPGIITVGDHLVVGDDHEQLMPLALQADAVGQRAEVVAEMKGAGRPVAGEDAGHGCAFR
jgi:hypothetical protein